MGQNASAIILKSGGGAKDRLKEASKNAAVLLSNRAETRLRLGDLSGAVVDAAASVFLDSKYQKAAFKLVKAYSQWLETRPKHDGTSRIVAHGLASSIARRWPQFHQMALFQKHTSSAQRDPLELWWEETEFVKVLFRLQSTRPDATPYVGKWSAVKAQARG